MEQIIARFLESNKRLVIPQLGAFIVKEPGQSVLFSELLKRDDGVLVSLMAQNGVDQVQATALIETFVSNIRAAIKAGKSFKIEGLGVLKAGENSTIAFQYTPSNQNLQNQEPAPTTPKTIQETTKEAIQEPQEIEQPAKQERKIEELWHDSKKTTPNLEVAKLEHTNEETPKIDLQTPDPQFTEKQNTVPAQKLDDVKLTDPTLAQIKHNQQPKIEDSPAPTLQHDSSKSRKGINDLFRNVGIGHQPTDQIDGIDGIPIQNNGIKISPSAKLNPAPHVKGLRYGKPHRNNNAFANSGGRRKIDRFLLFALASALVAVAVIAYVYFRDSREHKKETQEMIEQTTQTEAQSPQTENNR